MEQKDVPYALKVKIRNYIMYIEYYDKFNNPETIIDKLTRRMQIDLKEKGYSTPL